LRENIFVRMSDATQVQARQGVLPKWPHGNRVVRVELSSSERLACLHAKQFELMCNSNTAHCTPCKWSETLWGACESKSV